MTMTIIDNQLWPEKRQLASREIPALNHSLWQHLFITFVDGMRRAARAGVRAWGISRAISALRQMDDRMLRDIGITRSEIEYRVRKSAEELW
jgi:uncharacterized protein YjiS (DUF1127 family)